MAFPDCERRLAWERQQRLVMGARIARALHLLGRAEEMLRWLPDQEARLWCHDLAQARAQDFGPFSPLQLSTTEAMHALEAAQALLAALGDVDRVRARLNSAMDTLGHSMAKARTDGAPEG